MEDSSYSLGGKDLGTEKCASDDMSGLEDGRGDEGVVEAVDELDEFFFGERVGERGEDGGVCACEGGEGFDHEDVSLL